MKKLLFLFMSLIVITSCNDYSPIDITAEEIAYNKAFNEEYGNPNSEHNWGFINQPIIDYSLTRATTNPNSNEWETTFKLNVPNEVTNAEAEYVKNWFATHQNPHSESIHWEQFFIQYIDCKESQMNELEVKCLDGSIDHIYNFNNSTKATQYVYDAGTEAWSYSSNSATGKYYRQWDLYNIQYLSFTASDGKHYEGWYVGFDYETAKEGVDENSGEYKQFVFRDGYYNDWIVKVSPGMHQGYPITVRVMCEDLGNTFDWDWNDVVFDVSYVNRGGDIYATIVLRAAISTLKIYVGTTEYEAHELLGVDIENPTNVIPTPVIYTIKVNNNSDDNVSNAKSIPIYVVDNNGVAHMIENTSSPQKFACPDYVQWSNEQVNITETYPNFPTWVTEGDKFTDVSKLWEYNPKN